MSTIKNQSNLSFLIANSWTLDPMQNVNPGQYNGPNQAWYDAENDTLHDAENSGLAQSQTTNIIYRIPMTADQIINLLTLYTSNHNYCTIIAAKLNKDEDEVKNICVDFLSDWDAVETDENGPNKEQDAQLDRLLESYAINLICLQ